MVDENNKEVEISEEPVEETNEKQPEENLMESMEKEIETEEAKTEEAAVEEEARPKKKRKEEEEFVEERTYTIPLAKALIMPPRKRAPRAMHMIRSYVVRHMKIPSRAEEEDEEPPTLTITKEVNEKIWSRGIEKPPRKIRVRTTKDNEGNVTVHLAEGE
jgi:large subunit ribosomal protein L31e